MFRALTFNPSRKSLWALGKRVLFSASDLKGIKDDNRDKIKGDFAQIYRDRRSRLSRKEERIAPKDVKVHSSEIGKAIGLSRVGFWLDLIRKPPPSSTFLPFSDYRKLVKALERYKRLIPRATHVKPIILESLSACPRDDLVYKIEDSKIILLVKCPDLLEPYEELPLHYVLQAQALIALTDDTCVVHLYCWTQRGSSLFRISPSNVLWRKISLAVCDFWEDHVEPGRKRYKSDMDPLVELVDLVPSDRHRDFEDIRESCVLCPGPDRLLYEVSSIYLWLCERSEDNHYFPNQLVDRKSYHMFEAPIATRFKKREVNISDILYLGLTMYDHQHKKIPISLDDTLLSYILYCETLSLEDERLKGASFWSVNPGELYTEAIYHALLRELLKHSQNPAFSCLLRSLKVEAAARIKSGELSADMFLLWAKTLIRKTVPEYNSGKEVCKIDVFLDVPYCREDFSSPFHCSECYPVESLDFLYSRFSEELPKAKQFYEDERRLLAYDHVKYLCTSILHSFSPLIHQSDVHLLPDETKEAMAGLIFAASRIGELKELQIIRSLFVQRFGQTFDKDCVDLRPGNLVSSEIVKILDTNIPEDAISPEIIVAISQKYQTDFITSVDSITEDSASLNNLGIAHSDTLARRKKVTKENPKCLRTNRGEFQGRDRSKFMS